MRYARAFAVAAVAGALTATLWMIGSLVLSLTVTAEEGVGAAVAFVETGPAMVAGLVASVAAFWWAVRRRSRSGSR
jgi:hypothetical protein